MSILEGPSLLKSDKTHATVIKKGHLLNKYGLGNQKTD